MRAVVAMIADRLRGEFGAIALRIGLRMLPDCAFDEDVDPEETSLALADPELMGAEIFGTVVEINEDGTMIVDLETVEDATRRILEEAEAH